MGTLIRIPEYTIGVDEVGLGALAGPLVVCAVAVPRGWKGIPGLNDSKKIKQEVMRKELRNSLMDLVLRKQIIHVIESRSSRYIDQIGVGRCHQDAIESAIRCAVRAIGKSLVHEIIVDGNLNFTHVHPKVRSEVKADARFTAVQAASVMAKVHRDNQMPSFDPDGIYYFAKNKGYPSPEHKEALARFGPGPYHRMSYGPCAEAARRG